MVIAGPSRPGRADGHVTAAREPDMILLPANDLAFPLGSAGRS